MSYMKNPRRLATPVRVGKNIEYTASPTVSRFMQDDSFIRFILGPVGGGKTTGVLFEVVRRCFEQAPGRDGIRRTRWAIVRNTLSQLKQTVLRDIESWLGDMITFRPSENVVILNVGDVYSEWFLIPLSEPEDKKRLLSTQLTGIWINEFIEIDSSLLGDMSARCGRYPSPEDGGATWRGIVGDSNMPNIGSDWHKILELERPANCAVFIQPGGLDPDAENLDYLDQTPETLRFPVGSKERRERGRQYYERLAIGRSKTWIKRYIDAQYGDDPDGTAVFADTFSLDFHVITKERALKNPNLKPEQIENIKKLGATTSIPNSTLFVAQDFGRNPCSLLWQFGPGGQVIVLKELVAENTALETHIQRSLLPLLKEPQYASAHVLVIGDPSGLAAGITSEDSCFDVLRRYGLAAQPAPTNVLDARLRAVERLLTGNIGGKPMLLIDGDRCPMLVRAMSGLYRFGKTRDGVTKPVPDKTHPWSDLADCLQYACLCATGSFQTVASRTINRHASMARVAERKTPVISAKGWT